MSYPDVVNSSRNQGPPMHVNVTQRSQVSSAALIENEAGIKRGHVNSIASLFGQQQSTSAPRQTAHRVQTSTGSSHAKLSRTPVVPREASVYPSQAHATHASARSAEESSPNKSSSTHPVPWPKPTSDQLKPVKSFGKSDSNIYASSAAVDSRDASHSNKSAQPTIVFNKTKYVPRASPGTQKVSPSDKTQASETPGAVRVGRWTVYETLPFKDGAGLDRGREEAKQREREALQRREEDEYRKREALEKERMAEAERRKIEYDRRHREELEAQEMRHRKEMAADEKRRHEALDREREEGRRRAEEERKHRKELEKQERRRREEMERQMELERLRELERQDNERKLREKRQAEVEQQKEEERQQQIERRRRAERDEYERELREDYERRCWEERLKEEKARERSDEERKMRDSTPDVYTAEEWTVYEKVPLSSAELPVNAASARSQLSNMPSDIQGSSSTVGYRRFLGSDSHNGIVGVEASSESEYVRNLRDIEEANRRQGEESQRRIRDAERQRTLQRQEQEARRADDERSKRVKEERFREGVNQWSALAEAEPIASESAIGYRRFLDNPADGENRANEDEDERRRESARRGQEDGLRQREKDAARSRQMAEEERRRSELELERRRRLEAEDAMRREEERRRRQLEEERHRRSLEEERRRREDEGRVRQRETRWSNYDKDDLYGRFDQHRGRLGGFETDPDFFSRDEWTVLESVPVRDASVAQSTIRRSPSQDSVVGYRRLVEENANLPDSTRSNRSRSNETNTRAKIHFFDDGDQTGGRNRTETSTRYTRQASLSVQSTPKPDEDTPHFEEWTEYHPVRPQFQTVGSTNLAARGSGRQTQEQKSFRGRYDSDESSDAPKFEEWTVVHKVPIAQSQSAAAAYDVTDAVSATAQDNGLDGITSLGERDDEDWNDRDSDKNHSLRQKRRIQSTDNLNLVDSSEEHMTVEEIMPRRRDSGRRQRDALLSAALRQLGPAMATSNDSMSESADVTRNPTSRLSPYHSYQRIHHRGNRQANDAYTASDNGNVFQESFNVSRDNPAYYWRHN